VSDHVDEVTSQEAERSGRPLPHAAHRAPTPREYVRVGLILGGLTAFEVWMSYSGVSKSILIPTLFVAALVKFALVVGYFMHLKFDDRRYARFFVMGIAGAITLYLVVLLTFKVFLR
jgi:cytochrome c oxidase subunit 4